MNEPEDRIMLGIDIGFAATGWVAAEVIGNGEYRPIASGVIVTEKDNHRRGLRVADSDVERCQVILRELTRTFCDHRPKALAVELPTGGAQGARANRCMGMATAIAACIVDDWGLPCAWVTPQEVKKAVTGQRNASKQQMIGAIRSGYPELQWPKGKTHHEHVADAMGALLAARYGNEYRMLEP